MPEKNYYNDDYGLSTIGWISKDLENIQPRIRTIGFELSPTFSIEMNNNHFEAFFCYDNFSLSQEIMKIKTS